MRIETLFSGLALSTALIAMGSPPSEPPRANPKDASPAGSDRLDVEALKTEIIDKDLVRREFRTEWTRIHWRASMEEALTDAGKEGKPILVLLVLKEYGQTDSPMT